jgi:hypothetical protein
MRSLRDLQSTPRDVHSTGHGSLNAKVTRRTIFRFAAQLAPGLLMGGRDDGDGQSDELTSVRDHHIRD